MPPSPWFVAAVLTALAPAWARSAQAAPKTTSDRRPAPPVNLSLDIRQTRLDNGLRVVLNVDHAAPTVAVSVTYDVGSRNETPGRSGFAHLFEHMMFQGSTNVEKGEFFKLVAEHGGVANGTTSSDRTNYFEVLPSNQLALALWLEADRMMGLMVTPENFDNQRRVVEEEYRMRVSNAAYVPAQIRLNELVFRNYWPYEHDPVGSMKDLEAAKLAWVKAFHQSYYAPELAVLTIAGDLEPDRTLELVRRYFDRPRPGVAPPAYVPPPIPAQTSPQRAQIEDPHAELPAFYYGWMGPPARTPDHYALEWVMALLTDGESSRLHEKLVRKLALAQTVSGWTAGHRGPDLVALEVKIHALDKMTQVRTLVDAELRALAVQGPSPAEMNKVRNRLQADFVFGLQSNLQRAIELGEFELFWGDARLLNQELGRTLSVTREDIRRVIDQYLSPERRTVVEDRPTPRLADAVRKGGAR